MGLNGVQLVIKTIKILLLDLPIRKPQVLCVTFIKYIFTSVFCISLDFISHFPPNISHWWLH